ncbi:MAG TPA: HIT family protein [Nitrosospira sp.]|nr:HIT family protein [Nitrosospira sp.]
MISVPPSGTAILNPTMRKFGAPETIIHQFQYWIVMLRPIQLTLGSLVLAAHEPARSFSQLGQESFTELHKVTGQLESALAKAFNYDKLNYLMLMMVDPDVHFHVVPRYVESRYFNGLEFIDSGWPGPPDFNKATKTDADTNRLIREHLISCWP